MLIEIEVTTEMVAAELEDYLDSLLREMETENPSVYVWGDDVEDKIQIARRIDAIRLILQDYKV